MDSETDSTNSNAVNLDFLKGFFDLSLNSLDDDWTDLVQKLLNSLRLHLNMEVAFLSEFVNGKRRFKIISQANHSNIQVGDEDSLEDSYCFHIVQNHLPQLIKSTTQHKITRELEVTETLNIGSYIGVPVVLTDGKTYGTLCAFKGVSDSRLNQKDLAYVKVLADISATIIEIQKSHASQDSQLKSELKKIIDSNDDFTVKLHPIVDLNTGQVSGYEALSRIKSGSEEWPPDKFFESAVYVGLSEQATQKVLLAAKNALSVIPRDTNFYINITPDLLAKESFVASIQNSDFPLNQLVLEITEHSLIDDYHAVSQLLSPLREKGMRVAVDDAGAGYSSLRHVIALSPDIVKLDMTLTQNIYRNQTKQSLIKALKSFAKDRNFELVAEGIETPQELKTLQNIGINYGQGYLFDKPQYADYFIGKQKYDIK
ncbi:sensor domain-containing phosphodiesterase [Kangiella geojedonensis]|uniref:Diguanylate phosphodiesterase n=1 Tax=Kangiella geojedonensis TaxID=914150 RepID=A0A0F6RD01_9GAMM|nr:EAL domain-containing protein [Kangiella geojedonensis]AKE52496.1 diguanylate phosphodiesterase [Kangiella geojedonensis]